MSRTVRRLLLLHAGALALVEPTLAGPPPARWSADPSASRIVVHVRKKGALSGLAHDHHFVATKWRASASFDEARPADARLEVVVQAASLHDDQPALSDADRAKVDAQAVGKDVLDASKYPEIRFARDGRGDASLQVARDGAIEGEVSGTLSLHGKERPVAISIHATRAGDGWRVRGNARFSQRDFGIRPYSGFLGTIAVEDAVEVEYALALVPASDGERHEAQR